MNKSELIEAIATSADIPKTTATKVLDAVVDSITGALKAGDSVTLVGFVSNYVPSIDTAKSPVIPSYDAISATPH